jgi:predicted SAM-dependent methyltransferase
MNEPLRLHIGGVEPKAGWKILNAVPGPHVDFVGDVALLRSFADASVAEIYASHVIEHVSYAAELVPMLDDMLRVLVPGGRLMVSVPDLAVLTRLYASGKLDLDQRFTLMRIIFGGQVDQFDFHKAGFDKELLARFLTKVGFHPVRRVKRFGLFSDTSDQTAFGETISLNMEAFKPGGPATPSA